MKTPILLLTLLLLTPTIPLATPHPTPLTNPTLAAILADDTNPYYALIATNLACRTNHTTNTTHLLPLLITHYNTLTTTQHTLLTTLTSTNNNSYLLGIGTHITTTPIPTINLTGDPATISLQAALLTTNTTPTVLIIPDTPPNYPLALTATPLASFLDCPLIIYNTSLDPFLPTILTQSFHTHTAYIIGNTTIPLPTEITQILLTTTDDIQNTLLNEITAHNGTINYLAMTNPNDTTPPATTNTTTTTDTTHITATQLTLFGRTHTLQGNDTATLHFQQPDTISQLTITATLPRHPRLLTTLLFLSLYDPLGRLVAYTSSLANDLGNATVSTLAIHDPGTYTLTIRAFHGLRGGYFSYRGFSHVNTDITVTIQQQNQANTHRPLIPKLSLLAAYLAAAHGGIIITTNHELTTSDYEQIANGTAAGPWYTPELIPYNNNAVNATLQDLNHTLHLLNDHELLTDYLNGPAWLGILGDTTMIPMYYYEPSDTDIAERGLPSDNLYALNASLSTGRIIGWNVTDVSNLLVRTLFYQEICGSPTTDWFHTFNFVFGEGFGETGGLFHQIPYSREIRRYNLTTHVYGDLRNSRQITDKLHVYTGANFVEYLGHGDWYWYVPSLYGMNTYGHAVDVTHASQWVYEKPSVFLTSACLMGRVDGIPPQQNIGLAMLHAGCNAFVGATRETGSEAELTILENMLLVNDSSLGAALRAEKQIDQMPPNFYVRTLYGDPAFNPYDPVHGFTDQGKP
jgi:hypothetical protein